MKAIAVVLSGLFLVASFAQADDSSRLEASKLFDWMTASRERINKAGLAGDTAKLEQIRQEVMNRMSQWPRGPQIKPFKACGMALADMQIYLTAAIDNQPRKQRDHKAALFRQDLNDCKNAISTHSGGL